MPININTSNCVATHLLVAGIEVGAGALAGACLSVGVTVGAVYGATLYLANRSITWLCTKIFNLNNAWASQAAKVLSLAASFFASVGASVFALSLVGVTITLGSAISLSLFTLFFSVVIWLPLKKGCGVDFDPALQEWESRICRP